MIIHEIYFWGEELISIAKMCNVCQYLSFLRHLKYRSNCPNRSIIGQHLRDWILRASVISMT